MIDAEVRFGAYVPKVPQYYKDAAVDDSSPCSSKRLDSLTKADRCLQEAKSNSDDYGSSCCCFIGPRWTSLTMISITPYNHDTSFFEFALPQNQLLNLPATAHMLVKAPGREHDGSHAVRPYTSTSDPNETGKFTIMVKRYEEWGVPESKQQKENKFFFYVKTDHSYKPAGAVSNYIHSLRIGDQLEFKHTPECFGRISYPFLPEVTAITMIAVGAGVAPLIRILRELLTGSNRCEHVQTIRLLYGARTVADILQRTLLDDWHKKYGPDRFRVKYCVGSRWTNIHFAASTKDATRPPLPKGYEDIPSDQRALGWVDGEKVEQYGASSSDDDGHRIFVCGLPGVYLALVGPRSDPKVSVDSQLGKLGYRDHQVVKF